MTFINTLTIFILLIALGYGIYYLWLWIMRKRSAEMVEGADFMDIIRKVQVIDVRETPEFNVNHILGARNIPMSQFKLRFQEIRKDKAVYLYDDSLNYASRCANILRKNGYDQVYILKGGMSKWFGKVKSEL